MSPLLEAAAAAGLFSRRRTTGALADFDTSTGGERARGSWSGAGTGSVGRFGGAGGSGADAGVTVVGGPMAQHLGSSLSRAVGDVFDAYRQGIFGELPITRYALKDAAKAHADIEARKKSGIILLMP